MSWNSFPETSPESSGPFLISCNGELEGLDYYFKAIAFYSINTNVWFKYDSFDFNNEVKELIECQVVGWKNLGETFVG